MERYSAGMSGGDARMLCGLPGDYYERSGRDLLLNSWWIDPTGAAPFGRAVNQRGLAVYGSFGYTIDRWSIDGGGLGAAAVTATPNGITLAATEAGYLDFRQVVEQAVERDMTLTMAVQVGACTGPYHLLLTTDTYASSKAILAFDTPGLKVLSGAYAAGERPQVVIRPMAGTRLYTTAAKLEMGRHFTGWDIRDPAAELAQCQRYGEMMDGLISIEPLPQNLSVGVVRGAGWGPLHQ